MNLIIDQGNTACKLAVFENRKIINSIAINNQEPQKIERWIIENAENTDIIVSSVLSKELDLSFVKQQRLVRLNSKTPLPIDNVYQSPETLGND